MTKKKSPRDLIFDQPAYFETIVAIAGLPDEKKYAEHIGNALRKSPSSITTQITQFLAPEDVVLLMPTEAKGKRILLDINWSSLISYFIDDLIVESDKVITDIERLHGALPQEHMAIAGFLDKKSNDHKWIDRLPQNELVLHWMQNVLHTYYVLMFDEGRRKYDMIERHQLSLKEALLLASKFFFTEVFTTDEISPEGIQSYNENLSNSVWRDFDEFLRFARFSQSDNIAMVLARTVASRML